MSRSGRKLRPAPRALSQSPTRSEALALSSPAKAERRGGRRSEAEARRGWSVRFKGEAIVSCGLEPDLCDALSDGAAGRPVLVATTLQLVSLGCGPWGIAWERVGLWECWRLSERPALHRAGIVGLSILRSVYPEHPTQFYMSPDRMALYPVEDHRASRLHVIWCQLRPSFC